MNNRTYPIVSLYNHANVISVEVGVFIVRESSLFSPCHTVSIDCYFDVKQLQFATIRTILSQPVSLAADVRYFLLSTDAILNLTAFTSYHATLNSS